MLNNLKNDLLEVLASLATTMEDVMRMRMIVRVLIDASEASLGIDKVAMKK